MTIGQYLPDSTNSPIDLDNLILEFGVPDSSDVSLQDFYLGGSFVPDDPFYRYVCNIPETGAISFLDFYKRKSYTLSSSVDSADEGDTITIYLNTFNVSDGSNIPYIVTGIDSNDLLAGNISGSFSVLNSTSSISFTLLEDSTTEGLETLTVTLPGINQTVNVPINDTSALTEFINLDFSNQTILFDDGTNVGVSGWTATKTQIRLGNSSIGGFTTPTDPTPNPVGLGGQVSPGDGTLDPSMNYYVQFLTLDGRTCVRLYSSGSVSTNGDVSRGPYVISNDYVLIEAGSTVTFEWRAAAGGDAYDVFAYLLKDNGQTQILLNQTQAGTSGDTGWLTVSSTVNSTGNYKFVFVSGTFDYSFGGVAGASLYVTNISIT